MSRSRSEASVSRSLLSNDAQQTSRDQTIRYDRLSVDRTAEDGGGREMAVSADDGTCRSVELRLQQKKIKKIRITYVYRERRELT